MKINNEKNNSYLCGCVSGYAPGSHVGLYADFGINIYYLLAALYGLVLWSHGGKERKGIPITHTPVWVMGICIVATGAIWYVLYEFLDKFTNSTVPVADAFTTALSIVASWMLARKYIEQWIAWLVVDAVCVALYIYKDIPFYAVLYAVYTVIAVFGYRKWLRLM